MGDRTRCPPGTPESQGRSAEEEKERLTRLGDDGRDEKLSSLRRGNQATPFKDDLGVEFDVQVNLVDPVNGQVTARLLHSLDQNVIKAGNPRTHRRDNHLLRR